MTSQWEVAVLNGLSKIGQVEYEPNFSGKACVDLLFTSKESSALLDVTTVSDRGLGEANPVGQLCEELVEYVRERDLNPERFAVSVEATGGNFPLVDRNLRCFCPALRNFGCSSSMPTFKTFADSGRCRSAFRVHADHSFRGDPDQLIAIVGRVIAIPRNVSHRAK